MRPIPPWTWFITIPGVIGSVLRWIIGGVTVSLGNGPSTVSITIQPVSGYEVSTIIGVIFTAIVIREWKSI